MQSFNQRKCMPALEYFLEKDIHIVCLTETWFQNECNYQTAQFKNVGNYYVYNRPRVTETIGGGVCILMKDKFKKPVKLKKRFYASFESISILSCISNLPSQKIKFVSIYRRETAVFASFIDDFSSFVCDLSLSKYPFVIAGDFNIHMNDPRHSYTKRFNRLCKEKNLSLSHVPEVKTHIAGNTIDFLICDAVASSLIIECSVDMDAPKNISHHYPVIYTLKAALNNRSLATSVPRHNFRNFNCEHFKDDLSDNLTSLQSCHSFENKVNTFQEVLKHCYNKHAPLQQSKIKYNERPSWLDHEYVVQRALRRRLERKFKQTHSIEDEINFKMQRAHCALLVGEKVNKCYSDMIESSKGDARCLFNMYEAMVGNSKSWCSELPDIEEHGGNLALANSFNNYFINKVENTTKHIESQLQLHQVSHSCDSYIQSTLNDAPENSEYLSSFKPCDIDELKEIVCEHTIKVTYGIDPLPKKQMSDCMDVLLPHLLDLVNSSLLSGNIDGVKYALVKPLLKKFDLDVSEFSSFRSISTLSFVSKLIERVVSKRLNEHMTTNNLHINSQHGYKTNHSTETLLLKFFNDILVAIDKNRGVVVLLIDLSSAFDTVQHDILLKILEESIGVKGIALKWFRSFVSGRTQSVVINGCVSDWLNVTCGVPAGSVLGPILFNIYCRHIDDVFNKCGFTSASYADDNSACKSFAAFNQFNTLYNDVPDCLQKLKQYMTANHLKLNEGKTQIIVFGNERFQQQITLHGTFLAGGECIRFDDKIKYLGILFDSLLTLEDQIQSVTSVSYASLRKISSIRHCLSRSNLECLVHAFISSHLDYCNVLYMNLPKKLLNKLQKLQNAAIRIIFNVRSRHPVSSFFRKLHWLNIEQRVIFKCMLLVYKSIHGLSPNALNHMVVVRNRNTLTLQNIFYKQSKYGKRAFIYYASRYWNIIPVDIRCINTLSLFKTALKSYLIVHFMEFKSNISTHFL